MALQVGGGGAALDDLPDGLGGERSETHHPAAADPAKQRTRLDPGSGHPGPKAADSGSAHEQDRAGALLVRLAVLEGERAVPSTSRAR